MRGAYNARGGVVATLSPNTWKLVSISYLCRAGELTVSIDVVLGAGDSAVNACCLLLDSRASQNSAIAGRFWMIASGLLALYSWLTGDECNGNKPDHPP